MDYKGILSPNEAIRAKCLACMGGNKREVADCTLRSCALHGFRMGKKQSERSRQVQAARKEQRELKEAGKTYSKELIRALEGLRYGEELLVK